MFTGLLTPEGCEESWVYFEDFCYSFITGQVHFDTAREICSTIKQSTLVTLWKKMEYTFVTEHLKKVYLWYNLLHINLYFILNM